MPRENTAQEVVEADGSIRVGRGKCELCKKIRVVYFYPETGIEICTKCAKECEEDACLAAHLQDPISNPEPYPDDF